MKIQEPLTGSTPPILRPQSDAPAEKHQWSQPTSIGHAGRRSSGGISRRGFLKGTALAAGALAFPTIVPSSVFGQNAPGNRVAFGVIGVGTKGRPNMNALRNMAGAHVVALCDVDAGHLAAANRDAQLGPGALHSDYREMLARSDVDAVMIVTPDHWHALLSIDAMKAGKDVYCEKPMTLTIAEGRIMANAVKQTGRILQNGSQQRSSERFRRACELVRNGVIGQLKTVSIEIPRNGRQSPAGWKEEPVPEGFDYDFWLGPAPRAPYHPMRCHYSFRFIKEYSGGQMTNMGAHDLDIAQWGLGADDTGPVRIEGAGQFPPKEDLFSTSEVADITYTYANGVKVHLTQPGRSIVRFEGDKGSIRVNRGSLTAEPASVLDYQFKEGDVRLYESRNHFQNFIDCVHSRRAPIADVEIGHRSATVCHLGNIAMQLGRPLEWDPKGERFVNDPEADTLISRPTRAPWKIEV